MGKTALLYILVVFSLLISAFNINKYLSPRKVLGSETQSSDVQQTFWQNFLSENPTYIPGWIELGRLDKVKEIDPNYFFYSLGD